MFLEKLERVLGPVAEKLGNNKVLISIRNGFLVTTPLLIVASIFLVITNFPITGYSEFIARFLGTGWENNINPIVTATFDVIALISVIGIGYSYGKELNVDAMASAAVSLVSFLIITQQAHPEFVNEAGKSFKGLAFSSLGSAGLFLAMITALISVRIFAFVKKRGWIIKMPDGVPPAVTDSFAALIPSMIVMLFFLLIRLIFSISSYEYAHIFVYKILQAPLMGFGQSMLFEPLYQFLSTLFWFFGINGPAVTNTVFTPIHLALTTENLTAFKAGLPLPNIFTSPFGDFFGNFGGGGSTLSLVILMLFFGKSERMKKLGRLSIFPGIFGVNEMVIFGLPIVLNPVILIPFLLVPLMNITLATLATLWGIIPYTTGTTLPWTTPLFFSGWFSTGSWFAGIFQIFLLVLGCLVYYPFFKILDKQYLKEETDNLHTLTDDTDDISLDDLSFDDL